MERLEGRPSYFLDETVDRTIQHFCMNEDRFGRPYLLGDAVLSVFSTSGMDLEDLAAYIFHEVDPNLEEVSEAMGYVTSCVESGLERYGEQNKGLYMIEYWVLKEIERYFPEHVKEDARRQGILFNSS